MRDSKQEHNQIEFERQIEIATNRLAEELEDEVPREHVEQVMEKAAAQLEDARVKIYIPNLAYHQARQQLRAD